jgi:5'-nucleotidase / UDP-sugar diphosphatase
MRKALALLLFVGACGGGGEGTSDAGPPDAGASQRILFLYTNDEHSHLFGFAPEIDDFPPRQTAGSGEIVGSVARRATVLASERAAAAAAGIDTLTVSGGDQSQGALPQVLFATTAPDFVVLEKLGYDVMTLGNHEFDQGPAALASAILAAQTHGGLPQLVSSNIRFDADSTADDTLAALVGDGDSNLPIKRYHIVTTPAGIRVGFFGVVGPQAAFYAPLKAPVLFSAEADEENDFAAGRLAMFEDVRPVVADLRAQGVDLVVALSHSGVDLDDGGDDEAMAASVAGIDLIISAHSHTALPEPLMVEGPDGYTVPIVQAGKYGEYLGRVELVVREGQRPQVDLEQSRLIAIDDRILPTMAPVQEVLDDVIASLEGDTFEDGKSYLELALERILGTTVTDDDTVLGDLYYREIAQTTFDVIGLRPSVETNMIDLSTDALLQVANDEVTTGPTLIAIQAGGAVRADIVEGATGVLSFGDLWRAFPLGVSPDGSVGYPLVRTHIFLAELKAGFEIGVSLGFIDDSFFLSPAGVKVEYDTTRPVADLSDITKLLDAQNGRVTKITLDTNPTDGVEIYDTVIFDLADASPWDTTFGGAGAFTLIPVVTTYYVASFAADYGMTLKDSEGTPQPIETWILERPDGSSIKDWEAFIAYVKTISDDNGGFLPERYDEMTTAGALPRRMICSGAVCP